MTISLASRTITLAAGALLTGLALSGTGEAITDTVFQYTTPKNGFLSIAPAAFRPRTETNIFDNTGSSLQPGGDSTNPVANITTCYTTSINLPQSAKIKKLDVWYEREDSSNLTIISLWRHKFSGSVNEALVNSILATSSGAQTLASFNVLTKQTVNNQKFFYYLAYCGDKLQNILYGARLTYTYTTAGD